MDHVPDRRGVERASTMDEPLEGRPSKVTGRCAWCRRWIRVGDLVGHHPGAPTHAYRHAACARAEQARAVTRQARDEARTDNRDNAPVRAAAKGGLGLVAMLGFFAWASVRHLLTPFVLIAVGVRALVSGKGGKAFSEGPTVTDEIGGEMIGVIWNGLREILL